MSAVREHVIADLRARISAIESHAVKELGCSGVRRSGDRWCTPGRRARPWRIARVRWRRGGYSRRGSRSPVCRRNSRADEGADRLVPDAAGSLLPGSGAGGPASRPGDLRRVRQGRGRAGEHGRGAGARRSRRRGRRTRPASNDCIAPSAACGRAHGDPGVGGQAMATAD